MSDSYVEDLHEAVQIGDVVTAWVTGIDEKRRRVGLSAISPERERELDEARRNRDTRSHHGGGNRGGGNRGGSTGARPATGQRGQGQGERAGAASSGDRPARASGGGQGGQGGGNRGGAQTGGGGNRGGRDGNRGARPGGNDRRGGKRSFEKKPETYRVVAKADSKPLTTEMQDGKEPLRSFGDLMQFFGKDKKTVTEKETPPEPPAPSVSAPPSEPESKVAQAKPAEPSVQSPAESDTPDA